MKISDVIVSTAQIGRASDEQQTVITEPSVINESSPLLQRDRSTYEEPFSGLASLFPCSCSRGCLCCSIT